MRFVQIDALLARNANDADAHYVRGVLLRALESPPADILAAYARALELDPRHADAAYNSGVVEGRRGDHAAALTWFQRSATIDPTHGDAQYNVGQSAYNLGRFQEALDGFLCARALSSEPFDETKKVVQALHALGRFADAA